MLWPSANWWNGGSSEALAWGLGILSRQQLQDSHVEHVCPQITQPQHLNISTPLIARLSYKLQLGTAPPSLPTFLHHWNPMYDSSLQGQ